MQEYEHLYFNEDIHISIVFHYTELFERIATIFPCGEVAFRPRKRNRSNNFHNFRKSFSSRDDDKCYKMYKSTHITREQDTRIPHKFFAAEFFETVFYSIWYTLTYLQIHICGTSYTGCFGSPKSFNGRSSERGSLYQWSMNDYWLKAVEQTSKEGQMIHLMFSFSNWKKDVM